MALAPKLLRLILLPADFVYAGFYNAPKDGEGVTARFVPGYILGMYLTPPLLAAGWLLLSSLRQEAHAERPAFLMAVAISMAIAMCFYRRQQRILQRFVNSSGELASSLKVMPAIYWFAVVSITSMYAIKSPLVSICIFAASNIALSGILMARFGRD